MSIRTAATIAIAITLAGCTTSSDVSRTLGARCDSSGECAGRCLPDGAGYPGGFCTLVCNRSAECPATSACVDREGGACLFSCAGEDSCAFLGEGWRCAEEDLREDTSTKVMVCRGP
ncbi:MAG: hypothetical protein KIT31_39565 [Deltaproteobacteria bacterium]|nr:hypothetical protein [Deltaproteobacteria bacterium]